MVSLILVAKFATSLGELIHEKIQVEHLNTVPLSITREWQLCAAEIQGRPQKLSPFGLRWSDSYFENRYGFVRQFSSN
jgi:hypothetical protein